MDVATKILKLIDSRIEKILSTKGFVSKYVGTIVRVDPSDPSKYFVTLAGYDDTQLKFLDKTGELLLPGDNIIIESKNGNLTGGFISERFGSPRNKYLPLTGGDLSNELRVNNGKDIILKAATGSVDSGDIIFKDGSGNELNRLYTGDGTLNYMGGGGTTSGYLWHSGNSNRFYTNIHTHAMNTTGNQTITCGFRPKKIKITTGIEGSASVGTDSNGLSFGTYDGTHQVCLFTYGDLPSYGWFTGSDRLVYLYYPGGGTRFNIASLANITGTGFDLVWGANGTLPGVAINMLIEVSG